jgi:hypothetical protein
MAWGMGHRAKSKEHRAKSTEQRAQSMGHSQAPCTPHPAPSTLHQKRETLKNFKYFKLEIDGKERNSGPIGRSIAGYKQFS